MVSMPRDISQVDGNRVSSEIQESEALHRLLQFIRDRSTDAAFCFASEGRLVYASKTACSCVGYSAKELLKLSIQDVIPELDAASWTSYRQAIQQEGSLKVRSHLRSKAARISPIELTIDGFVVNGWDYYCASVRDLTEPSSLVEALEQSEARCQKLTDNLPGTICQFQIQPDGSLFFTYVSSSCRKLLEVEPAALQQDAMLLKNLVHPDHRESFELSIERSSQTLQAWNWEGQLLLPSGKIQWIQATSQPERQANNEIVWDGLLININERKQTEVALQNHLAAMQASIDGMAIANRDRELTYLNAAHANMYGYDSPEELLGQPWTILYGADEMGRLEQEVLLTLEQQGHWRGEAIGKRHDGSTFPQELSLTKLDDGGIVCVVRDITERKQAELALQQANEQLEIRVAERTKELQQANEQLQIKIEEHTSVEESLRQTLHELQKTQAQLIQTERLSSLGQLVAGIAHEINNPVSFIYGNLPHADQYIEDLLYLIDLYQQHHPQPALAIREAMEEINFDFVVEDLPKLLSSIQLGADRIRQIVLSLRNFSRLDEAQYKPVDLHAGIDSTLLLLQNRLIAKRGRPDIRTIKEYGQLPLVECYASQLNQVFMNLLSNAIDALEESRVSDDKERSLCIWIRTEVQDSDNVAIRIIDNGIGMTPKILGQLFTPFFTTKPAGKGTGLGLSISYQIVVEKHGGKLQCFSTPGEGTEFLIQLPIRQVRQEAA
ncbi:MAG TPA: PAS domain S-box protein [Allocoleopsis sp.]